MSDAFHELFEINAAGTPIDFPVADSFIQWTTVTPGIGGPSDLLAFDAGNNQLVVGPNGKGTFGIFFSCDFGGSTNTMFTFAIFINGIRQPRLEFADLVRPPNDRMDGDVFGGLAMVPGDTIDLRFAADIAARTLVLFGVKLWVIGAVRAI